MAALKEFLKTTIIRGLMFPVLLIKRLGVGSAEAFRAADLTPVPGG